MVDGNTINTDFVRNETLVRYCPALAIRRLHFGSFECLKCYYDTVIFLCLFAVHDCSSRIGVAGNGQPTRPAPISVGDFFWARPSMRFQDPERDADKPAACWHSAPTFVRPPCPTDAVADAEPPTVTASRVVGTWRCSSPSGFRLRCSQLS